VEPEFEPLAIQADEALIAFLRAELALGFAYAQTVRVEAGLDSEGEKRAKGTSEGGRRFIVSVIGSANLAIRLELQVGAAKLEKLLSEGKTVTDLAPCLPSRMRTDSTGLGATPTFESTLRPFIAAMGCGQ